MTTKPCYDRGQAYERVYSMVDASMQEAYPAFEVKLLAEKRILVFERDFPPEIVEKIAYTSTHADIDHGAYQFEIGALWSRLSPDELKLFLKTLLDNQRWFTVSYGGEELYFVEY